MKLGTTIALLTVSIIGIGLSGGCEGVNSPKRAAARGAKFFVVKVKSAPFYRLGPAQLNGADKILQKDTLVTLVRPETGFSKVQLASGDQGYVANDYLTTAPPAAIAAINAPPASRPRLIPAEPNSSRFNPPDLPAEIEPTPIPVP